MKNNLAHTASADALADALIVCSHLEGFARPISADYRVTVAVDGGAHYFHQRNSAPDYAVGDFDSIDAATLDWLCDLQSRGVTCLQQVPADKDYSDLELALNACENLGVESAHILGAVGGRLDHQLCVMGALLRSKIPQLQLIAPDQSISLLRQGQSLTLPALPTASAEKNTFSIVCLNPAIVSVAHARWPLDRVQLQPLSSLGLSNLYKQDVPTHDQQQQVPPTITAHTGELFVITIC